MASRERLEQIIRKGMWLEHMPADYLKNMSMDQLTRLADSVKDVDPGDPPMSKGGTVSKRAKGGITNFKGHF